MPIDGDDDPRLSAYRPNVGVALFNAEGLVFLGKRAGERAPYCWQMPQGGVDDGEDPEIAALRELEEETGVTPACVRRLGAIDRWLVYDFPPEVRDRTRRRGRTWAGQKQRWFAYAFTGRDGDVRLDAHAKPEFDAWRWERLEAAPDLVIPWKRPVYSVVATEFAPYAA